MPLSTYSILLPPYVALTVAELVDDIQTLDTDCNIGYADTVNYLCNRIVVGRQYIFRRTNATIIVAGGTEYIIVPEKDVLSKQIIPV